MKFEDPCMHDRCWRCKNCNRRREGKRRKDKQKNNMPLNFWDIIFMLRANQLTKSDTVGSMDITIRYTCFDALRPSQQFFSHVEMISGFNQY